MMKCRPFICHPCAFAGKETDPIDGMALHALTLRNSYKCRMAGETIVFQVHVGLREIAGVQHFVREVDHHQRISARNEYGDHNH